MTDVPTTEGPSFADIGGHLSTLDGRTQALARRSRRFSWFCWAFLFAVYASLLLYAYIAAAFAVVTTTTTAYGTSSSSVTPWWALPVSAIPGIALLSLAVREALLGDRDADRGAVATVRASRPTPDATAAGWTETVQHCQQRVTHAKSEVEWSFVPLVLGWFAFVELYVIFLLQYISTTIPALAVFVGPAIAFGSLIVLWPLYRFAKEWVRGYQLLLDQQVGELSKLEAEFLWRFAGAGLPA